ncbi:aminotransferase class V-fold PLP-dependent enzyme [Fusibacter paucivorans]|uniref:Aminotransferase class V-fold PLP-dependent enzyme n=1 Tax=Fusibacter paucivorans TaxID=76009 RepID=A0ABS5PNW4_9FIRM|nr:aminotransferase class V-fold PLP-dependent enzyme [Fusibacter paucivorans]MBS7526276.1 aminotransferase class V-fold PLP-dependent enzyme [Fusibacter paucivorans]
MQWTVNELRKEVIGSEATFKTSYGERFVTYADYTASGKTLKFIEKYMITLQEMYANSHTEDSETGKVMTALVHKAEEKMKKMLNADDYNIFAVGTGATGAIHKLISIFGLYYAPGLTRYVNIDKSKIENRPVVFISSYEHHSNDLMWRESIAEVVIIGLTPLGEFDLKDLEEKVSSPAYKGRLKIGSFSAASNVTGIKSPVYEIAKIMHAHGGYACFDFAASGPYVDINMKKDDESYFDAIYLSMHKFIGGPASSGLLVLNSRLYDIYNKPTIAGGGTVDYVSVSGYDFSKVVEERERAGTPGILQIFKASLALEVKEKIGIEQIEKIEHDYISRVMYKLMKNDRVEILGSKDPSKRVSILSFNIRYEDGYLHHKFIAKLLNDLFGIQSRAGCACAGPYGHELLHIASEVSSKYREIIKSGINALKPGWVRVNFHYAMSPEAVDFIADAILFIADNGHLFLQEYQMHMTSGLWTHKDFVEDDTIVKQFGIDASIADSASDVFKSKALDHNALMKQYMVEAKAKAEKLAKTFNDNFAQFDQATLNDLKWYYVAAMTK